MKRNTVAAIIAWLLIAAGLIFAFNKFPEFPGIPSVLLVAPAVAIILYYLIRQKHGELRTRHLVLGRLTPRLVATAGTTLFVIAIAWIVLFARAAESNPDKVLYLIVLPVLGTIALGSVLIAVAIYYTIKRD